MKKLIKKWEKFPSVVGIIDSGIGGISVLNALGSSGVAQVVYVADTAYLPYGQQPYEVLLQRGCFITDFLVQYGITTIIVACHTASATILPELEERYPYVTFIDLLVPTIEEAVAISRTKIIGVLATTNTVHSKIYPRLIMKKGLDYTVIQQACPDLVPLLESPSVDERTLNNAVASYLQPILESDADTLILGCTHYAFLNHYLYNHLTHKCQLISAFSCLHNNFKNIILSTIQVTFFVTGSLELFKIKADRVLDYSTVAKQATSYYSL